MSKFDWNALLTVGLRRLGLRPQEFWSLTPAELRLMLGESDAGAPMLRTGLQELMSRFPDDAHPCGKEGSA